MTEKEWDRAVEEIGPRLYRYFKYRGAGELAADLTQETFIRLLRVDHRFDPNKGPMLAFALGVAQNIWRESNRQKPLIDSIHDHHDLVMDSDLQGEIESKDQAEKVKAIVRRLSQIQQDILYFYFDEEITTREIGSILSLPEGTVKSHLHRAKEMIKVILERELL